MKHFKKINSDGFSVVEMFLAAIFLVAFVYIGHTVYNYARTSQADIGSVADYSSPCIYHTFGVGSSGHCVRDLEILANWKSAVSPKLDLGGSYTDKTSDGILQVEKAFRLPGNGNVVNRGTWDILCKNTTSPGDAQPFSGITYTAYKDARCGVAGIEFTAAPPTINSGESSKLTWKTTDATSCTGGGGWSGSKSVNGSEVVGPYTTGSKKVVRFVLTCTGSGGSTSIAVDLTVLYTPSNGGGNCSPDLPTAGVDPTYPLIRATKFDQTTTPSNLENYGNSKLGGGGYIESLPGEGHLVPTTNGLLLKSFPDTSQGYPGSVGAGFDLKEPINGPGGMDVCFSLQGGTWQDANASHIVKLVLFTWPLSGDPTTGEIDMFEGNPQSPALYVHEIGANPKVNWEASKWPESITDGGQHRVSARWDPLNGYRFWLDNTLIAYATLPAGDGKTTPTTPHHISIQIQDVYENSSAAANYVDVKESATIYWAASYGYNG